MKNLNKKIINYLRNKKKKYNKIYNKFLNRKNFNFKNWKKY